MIVELAIATAIPVSAWAAEPEEIIATAVDVLWEQARRREHQR